MLSAPQHRGYKETEGTIFHDIALLITDTDIDFSSPAVQPVPSLSNRKLDWLAVRNDRCVSTGWGVYIQTEGKWD